MTLENVMEYQGTSSLGFVKYWEKVVDELVYVVAGCRTTVKPFLKHIRSFR